jgi:protein-S-isoprenylcysteine O-methyltransferase Ste14
VTPLFVSFLIWDAWALSWGLAAVWTRRTQARPAGGGRFAYLLPTVLGAALLFFGSAGYGRYGPRLRAGALWSAPEWLGWALVLVEAAGFAFTWWARVALGSLWSGTVTRKTDHVVVERGPYALVRHPIYTGLIVAAFALAIQFGGVLNLAGAALMALGCWMKARLEERFLTAELGDAYAAYRARTPMLTPFWPTS